MAAVTEARLVEEQEGRLSFGRTGSAVGPTEIDARRGRVNDRGSVDLAVEVKGAEQRFFYRQNGNDWQPLGPPLNAAVISDEGGRGEHGSFTGAFVGMLAFDTTGLARTADFTRFSYAPEGT